MFITRATRRDLDDVKEFLEANDWHDVDLSEGTAFIAREGRVTGVVRLVEVEPQTLVVDSVLVTPDKRGGGTGTQLMRALMNSRGGTLYLCCHEERIPFYERLGFSLLPLETAPESVRGYWTKVGDIPTDEGHVHYFMKAR